MQIKKYGEFYKALKRKQFSNKGESRIERYRISITCLKNPGKGSKPFSPSYAISF